MTKTIKKGFIVLLMLVASLFFAFAAGTGFNSVSADAQADAAAFVQDVENFKTKVTNNGTVEFDSVAIRNSMLEKDTVTLFFKMYFYVSTATDIPESAAAARLTYNQIFNQYNLEGSVDLYAKITSSVFDIYTKVDASYVNSKNVAKEARQNWNTIYGKANDLKLLMNSDLTFVKEDFVIDTSTTEERDVPEILVKAEKQIKDWEANINAAITAIKDIKVVTDLNDTSTVKVFDADTNKYLATYVGVLESANSLKAAADAIAVVRGELNENCLTGSYDGVNHLDVYNKVKASYDEQKKAVDDVVALIKKAYEKFNKESGKEVCYSINDKIVAARTEYDKLTNTVVNDLKGAVANYSEGGSSVNYDAKLTEMEAAYTVACNNIAAVADKINAIGEVKYNGLSKKAIAIARDAFDGVDLPNDVRVHDNEEAAKAKDDASYAPVYWVKKDFGAVTVDYGTLLKAEAKWAEYQQQVDNSVKAINDLIKKVTDATFFSEYNKMYKIVNEEMTDINNQLVGDSTVVGYEVTGVWATALDDVYKFDDYKDDIVTCKDAYEYCRKFATQISEKTQQISKDIKDVIDNYYIGFTNGFEKLYQSIIKNINELHGDQRYLNAIVNYEKWTSTDPTKPGIKEQYEMLLALAESAEEDKQGWIVSIVNGVVTVNDFDKIGISVEKYEALKTAYGEVNAAELATDLDNFTERKFNEKNYKEWFKLYNDGLTRKDDIIAATEALKIKIEGLVRPNLEDVIGSTTAAQDYAIAVGNVTADYDKLADNFDNGIAGDITRKYFQTNYAESFEKYQEALTNVIANSVEQKIALIVSDAAVVGANRIAEARIAYNGTPDVAKGKDLSDKDFIRNYASLTDAEKAVNEFITSVKGLLEKAAFDGKTNVAESDINASAIITKDNLTKGMYRVETSITTSLLEAYVAMSEVYKAYSVEEAGVVTSVANANKLLNDIVSIVSKNLAGTKGSKIAFIDSALNDYILAYNANSPTGSYDVLKGYVDALTASQQALLSNFNSFDQIKRDKEVADQLKNAIDKLAGEMSLGKITNETVIDYYIINSIYENLNESQKALLGKDEDGTLTATNQLKTIKTQIDAAMNVQNPTVIDVAAKLAELEKSSKDLDDAIKALAKASDVSANKEAIAELQTAKTAIDRQIETLNKTLGELAAKDTELAGKIDNIVKETDGTIDKRIALAKAAVKSDYEEADSNLKQTLVDADKAIKEALEKEIEAVKKTLDAAIKTETEAREAAVKAANEAREAETKKLHNAIVTISIIFSIVMVALAACVFVLFLKKKA